VRARISIGLQVIIRPRGGDFCYEEDEMEVMKRDIAMCKNLGADGVVFGILDREGHVDISRTRELVDLARPLSTTFHRAFDMSADLSSALEDVRATGADRILTSGGESDCLQGAEMIARLVQAARGITIMACGGITRDKVSSLIQRTRVSEIHVGLSSTVASPMRYRNGRISLGKVSGREYDRTQVLEEDIRRLQQEIAALD